MRLDDDARDKVHKTTASMEDRVAAEKFS